MKERIKGYRSSGGALWTPNHGSLLVCADEIEEHYGEETDHLDTLVVSTKPFMGSHLVKSGDNIGPGARALFEKYGVKRGYWALESSRSRIKTIGKSSFLFCGAFQKVVRRLWGSEFVHLPRLMISTQPFAGAKEVRLDWKRAFYDGEYSYWTDKFEIKKMGYDEDLCLSHSQDRILEKLFPNHPSRLYFKPCK